MAISFGVTVLPDPPYARFLELLELAERHGFEYAWTYDSHVLWQESIPTLALVADRTSKIKLGHMVTNPGTREPTVLASAYATLHDISNGRMIMGIGRGDSARRYIGQQPAIKGAWAITDHFNIAIQTAVFVPGTAAKNYAVKANEYYLALTLNYRF